jgi:hypothetical protein
MVQINEVLQQFILRSHLLSFTVGVGGGAVFVYFEGFLNPYPSNVENRIS